MKKITPFLWFDTQAEEAAPKAKERISYGIPFYEYKSPGYKGRMVYFGTFKNHVSMFVVPEAVPPAIAKQLKPYKVAKSTLRFPIGTKVPVSLIKKLVKLRMKEINQTLKPKTKKKRIGIMKNTL